jgi:hypothetical protein
MDLPLSDFRRMEVEEFDTSKLLAHAAKQATERGYKNFPIVDVDSHHYESESIGEILDYMDDPVLQQLARSARQANAKSVGMLPAGVGYQDMGGRVMRYAVRGMEKTEVGVQRDIALTRRCSRHVSDADAPARTASASRGRGGSGARLQSMAHRAGPGARAAHSLDALPAVQ